MAKLKNLLVQFISLVDKAANHREFVWKADGGFAGSVLIRKVDEEKRMVYGVVYTPDEVDSQGDYADAPTIERAAHEFLKQQLLHNVDTQHDFQPEKGYVAESYLIRGVDALFPDDKEGTWVVAIKVEDDEVWKAVKAGDYTGLSLAGTASREEAWKRYESFNEMVTAEGKEILPWQFADFLFQLALDHQDNPDELKALVADAIVEYKKLKEAQ